MRAATRWLARGWLALLLLVWGVAGVYSVDSDESAVAFVFGRAVGRDVLPGIHWNPPWPVGRVVVAKTATSFTMPVGFRLAALPDRSPISDLWLTGDTNVVTARLMIQYSIASLADYELRHEDPRELLRRAGEQMATRFLVGQDVDAALTASRQDLRRAVREGVQRILDREGVGIQVRSVTIQELAPPRQGRVRSAFQEVQDARSDMERTLHEARAYRAQALARARGRADRVRSEAHAARHRRVELARGGAERFRAIAREHARAPAVTEQRLYLEALERILPRVETHVMERGPNGTLNLRVTR